MWWNFWKHELKKKLFLRTISRMVLEGNTGIMYKEKIVIRTEIFQELFYFRKTFWRMLWKKSLRNLWKNSWQNFENPRKIWFLESIKQFLEELLGKSLEQLFFFFQDVSYHQESTVSLCSYLLVIWPYNIFWIFAFEPFYHLLVADSGLYAFSVDDWSFELKMLAQWQWIY